MPPPILVRLPPMAKKPIETAEKQQPEKSTPHEPYQSPSLVDLGSFLELTQGPTGRAGMEGRGSCLP